MRTDPSASKRGQSLVIVALGMVVLVGMVGVVVDVGLQWGDNRASQNGSDAAAEAGAVVLMQYMLGAPKMDADVEDAVDAVANTNQLTIDHAEYTDWQGHPLTPPVEVGYGGGIPTGAQGVLVVGTRAHETVFARVLGISELSVFTDAVAVAGPAEPCPVGGPCALLPVTIPTTIVTCDGQNKSLATLDPWIGPSEDPSDPPPPQYIIPLCGNNPGSVGWIDWTPPAGGNDELAKQICDPHPIDLDLPDWYYVTSTGNTNSSTVQDCWDKWIGKVIMFPLFEDTCKTDPGENTECTDPAPIGGQNQWYYFPSAAALTLTGAYVNGNNSDICDPSGGNGATTCLIGTFVDTAITGKVTEWDNTADPLSQFFSVQLIQ
ncbi:pilus assembly protein TadG-related protein [Mycobacterium sp.]|uniref:pilus assembly protein TadG-related protein n=1 Tax=Mycobacterium sp. TaxID=1785 RepID=UPI002D87BE5B|nr:pilus assembly protein TadG-related protein [Mycobacterium sp.]